MATAVCPECRSALPEADAKSRKTVRCPGCGVSVPLRPPDDPLAFPEAQTDDETLLDLSDTVRALRKKKKNEESS